MGRRARAQGGFAMVTVIGMLALGLLLAAAAFDAVEPGIGAAVHDQHSRRAVQAALSGIDLARRRLNELMPDLGALVGGMQSNVCIGVSSDPVTHRPVLKRIASVGTTSWCPPVTVDLGTGTSVTYQVSPVTVTVQSVASSGSGLLGTLKYTITKLLQRRVVATGDSGAVRRRVMLDLSAQGVVKATALMLVSGGSLDIYREVPGSFRECRSTAVSSSAPDADC